MAIPKMKVDFVKTKTIDTVACERQDPYKRKLPVAEVTMHLQFRGKK
jgi:hypothetical protein